MITDVKCPRCGATFPYGLIVKQVAKRKHDLKLLLRIISEFGEIRIGELAKQYNIDHGSAITLRHLNNIVRQLENEGKITTKRLHMGARGTTTLIQKINNTDLTDITSVYIHHV